MKFDDIVKELEQYNFTDAFLWLQIAASHPSNQKYAGRFDLLNSLLLSIHPDVFANKPFRKTDCERLLNLLQENYGTYFVSIEDFVPFDQLKLIPYFFEGNKYFFYYSIYESPFEELENFDNIYLKIGADAEIPELKTIKSIFKASLEFQTLLLNAVSQIEESKISREEVYVPSQEYLDAIVPYLEISQSHQILLKEMPTLAVGEFSSIQTELSDKILDYSLYETFKVQLPNGKILFLWPGRHIDVLHTFAFNLLKNSEGKTIIQQVHKNCQQRLAKACRRFFTIRGSLVGLYSQANTNNLLDNLNYAAVSNGCKILLFKLLPVRFDKTIDELLILASQEVQHLVKEIKQGDIIGLRYADNPSKVPAIPTAVAEIYTIYIIPKLTLEPIVFSLPEEAESDSSFLVLNDITRIFELISSPLAFIKFLKDDDELKKNTRILNTDFLDRFICYIENGNTFSRQGKPYFFILFEPHSWSNYYFEKLYNQSKDCIYELIERYFPDYFNEIKEQGNGVYGLNATSTLTTAYATQFNDGLFIASLPPDGYFCIGDEIKFSEFIAHFYAYYFNKYEKQLHELFESYGICIDKLYGISVIPVTYIKRNNITHLLSIVSKVNEQNPIEIMTGRIQQTMNLRTAVVFDWNGLSSIFSQKDNQGEKIALCKLLVSLLKYIKPSIRKETLEAETKIFIDKIIPTGLRAFSLDEMPIDNPKAERYRDYEEPNGSDIARVHRQIAEFIANNSVEPGEYDGEKAIAILESSFDFISNTIEKELSKCNSSVIYYAFEQLDFVELGRVNLSIRAGVDSSKYTEYDVKARFMENYDKLSKIAISIKYLCTNIIKLNPSGNEAASRYCWDNLLALADSAVNLSYAIDFLKYDLRKHKVHITEMYEIKHDIQDYSFDITDFAKSEAQNKIVSAQDRYSVPEKQNGQKAVNKPPFLNDLDIAFSKQYGFKFMDMVCVMFALGKFDATSSSPNLVNECSKTELIDFLKYEIAINCPSVEDLNKIIDFISIEQKSIKKEKVIPTQIFRERKRLNLCPIYNKGGMYFFGNQMCIETSKFWTSSVYQGDFPYKIDEHSPIGKCMSDYRRKLDKELEKEAEGIIFTELGVENYEANILNFTRLSKDFPKRPDCGEIDILAVNKKTKTMFLFDAKNRKKSVTPYGVKSDIDEFLKGKKSYFSKIMLKEKFIKNNWEKILKHFSVTDYDGWILKRAFIVKKNYQIAYHYKKAIDFVEINELVGYLKK